MDKFITTETSAIGINPRNAFFEPFEPASSLCPKTISLSLIIYDPTSDSALTPNWTIPAAAISVPASISLGALFALLREHLPTSSPKKRLSSGSSKENTSPGTILSRNSPRKPKLTSVKLFLTNTTGVVIPLCKKVKDWHYKGGITKVDLTHRTEAEWCFCRELLSSAQGEMKCFVAVKGASSRGLFSRN